MFVVHLSSVFMCFSRLQTQEGGTIIRLRRTITDRTTCCLRICHSNICKLAAHSVRSTYTLQNGALLAKHSI